MIVGTMEEGHATQELAKEKVSGGHCSHKRPMWLLRHWPKSRQFSHGNSHDKDSATLVSPAGQVTGEADPAIQKEREGQDKTALELRGQ
jgi:hypothetical protein